jgi:hypothetical protein
MLDFGQRVCIVITTMATLHPKSLDWPQKPGEDFMAYLDRKDKLVDELAKIRKLVYFPWGDGSAVYLVYSEKPLVLQHINVGDAWQVPYSYIRGTTLADVNRDHAARKALEASIAERQAARQAVGT